MSSVDALLKNLPEQVHNEVRQLLLYYLVSETVLSHVVVSPFCCPSQVSMAHKVLSSDMSHLVEAMRNAQKQYQTFLEQEYQKQMLHAAHIVAVNAKQLLDAANSARRRAYCQRR